MPVEKPNFCCCPNVPSFSNPHVPLSKAISQSQEFFKLPIGMNLLNPHMFFPLFVHGFPIFSMVSLGFPRVFPGFPRVVPMCSPCLPRFIPRAWPGGDPPGSAGGSCGLAMLGSGGQFARWVP